MLTAEQKAERRLGLGASDAAAAVGLSPWKSPYQLWLEKLGRELALDPDAQHEEALHLELGRALEPVALAHFCRKTNLTISRQQERVIDPNWSKRWVSLDAWASDGTPVEAKTTGFADPAEWGDEFEDGAIPMYILLQNQHSLACTGAPYAWVPLIVSNRQFRLYRVTRDDDLIQLLTQKEMAFWTMVLTEEAPPATTIEDVKLRWPSDNGKKVQATAEVAAKIAEHAMVRTKVKQLGDEKDVLELAIKLAMADCSELVDVEGLPLVTWRQAKASRRFHEDKFALENPALYAKYLRDIPGSRRFLNKLK